LVSLLFNIIVLIRCLVDVLEFKAKTKYGTISSYRLFDGQDPVKCNNDNRLRNGDCELCDCDDGTVCFFISNIICDSNYPNVWVPTITQKKDEIPTIDIFCLHCDGISPMYSHRHTTDCANNKCDNCGSDSFFRYVPPKPFFNLGTIIRSVLLEVKNIKNIKY
jgi:hypothetical protein